LLHILLTFYRFVKSGFTELEQNKTSHLPPHYLQVITSPSHPLIEQYYKFSQCNRKQNNTVDYKGEKNFPLSTPCFYHHP